MSGDISAASGTFTGDLSGSTITGGSINIGSGTFTVDSSGNMSANQANISGTISSYSGNIGGWIIDGNNLRDAQNITILRPGGVIDIGGDLNATGNVDSGANVTSSQFILANFRLGQGSSEVISGSYRDIVRDDVDGQIYLTASKRELKKDIEYYSNGIEIIKKLSPARFRWKNWRYTNEEIESMFLEKKHYGFIAEDVAAELPNFVAWDNESGSIKPQMWDTQSVISVSVAAIKELIEKVESLENRIR